MAELRERCTQQIVCSCSASAMREKTVPSFSKTLKCDAFVVCTSIDCDNYVHKEWYFKILIHPAF